MGICAESCLFEPELVFSIVTWLGMIAVLRSYRIALRLLATNPYRTGWLNSAMNPAIYACWSRDFRRAFRKILCSCCTGKQRRDKHIHNRFSYCAAKVPKMTKPNETAIKRKGNDEFVLNSLQVRNNSCGNAAHSAQHEMLQL